LIKRTQSELNKNLRGITNGDWYQDEVQLDMTYHDYSGLKFKVYTDIGIDLEGSRITDCTFRGEFPNSNFSETECYFTVFDDCNIHGSNFKNAQLMMASFVNAVLDDCDFSGADLTGANFRGASLSGSGITPFKAGRLDCFIHYGDQYHDGHYIQCGLSIGSSYKEWLEKRSEEVHPCEEFYKELKRYFPEAK